MKPVRWSAHAARRIAKREIDAIEAELTVKQPDSLVEAALNRRFYLDRVLNQPMLMRVLVEETDAELLAVTLYKTSKFAKYEERGKT